MKAKRITPNFEVTDIKQTVKFYTDILGFKLTMAVPHTLDGADGELENEKEYVYALVTNNGVEVSFQRTDSFYEDVPILQRKDIGASISFYIEVEDIESFHNDLKNKNIEATELKTSWYGMREFFIKDNNGYILCIAQQAEK